MIDKLFAGALLKYGMTFKNESFSEEKEVRVIHGYDQVAAESDMFEYRVTENDLISFIEIPLDIKNDYRPIKKVVLGPKCQVSPKSLEHFLYQNLGVNSIDIDIRKSNSSYR